ncbi:MAG: PilZ domain-containing protein [Candidatus Omnitrophota bacterium]
MYEERRKYPRLSINIKVNWDIDEVCDLSQSCRSDITKNISEGGICLIVYDKVDIGHTLRLKIELPTKKVVESKGKVVWVKEFEIIGNGIFLRV